MVIWGPENKGIMGKKRKRECGKKGNVERREVRRKGMWEKGNTSRKGMLGYGKDEKYGEGRVSRECGNVGRKGCGGKGNMEIRKGMGKREMEGKEMW